MKPARLLRLFVVLSIAGTTSATGLWYQTAPAASVPPVAGPGPAGAQAPAAPGRGQGGRGGFAPVQIGPSAPVPPEVAMQRPSASELAQINAALKTFIDTNSSPTKDVLKKY